MNNNKQLGIDGEKKAEVFLSTKGYKIVDKNFFSKFGEIDIVAYKKNTLCFIEVKHYSNRNLLDIHFSISKSKQKKIIKTAKYYIAKHNIKDKNIRFDVIFIVNKKIEHLPGAFFT